MAQYQIDLSEDEIKQLAVLAKKRRTTATEIIRQAIATESLIAENVDVVGGDELLIKKGDKYKKVTFR